MEYRHYAVLAKDEEEAKELVRAQKELLGGCNTAIDAGYYYRFDLPNRSWGRSSVRGTYEGNGMFGVDKIFDDIQEWRDYVNPPAIPEKWAILVTTANRAAVEKFFSYNKNVSPAFTPSFYYHFPEHTLGLTNGGNAWNTLIPGYTVITDEQFQKYINKQKMTNEFPKYWSLKSPISQKLRDVLKKNLESSGGFNFNSSSGYVYQFEDKKCSTMPEERNKSAIYTEVTEDQVIAYLTAGKIVGYKAPTDLFNGSIKKDDLIVKNDRYYDKDGSYRKKDFDPNGYSTLPKELVETWEPVYEESKVFSIGTPAFEVKVSGNSIEVSKYKVNTTKTAVKAWLNKIQSGTSPSAFGGNTLTIKEATIHIGCSEGPDVTLTELNSILKED